MIDKDDEARDWHTITSGSFTGKIDINTGFFEKLMSEAKTKVYNIKITDKDGKDLLDYPELASAKNEDGTYTFIIEEVGL